MPLRDDIGRPTEDVFALVNAQVKGYHQGLSQIEAAQSKSDDNMMPAPTPAEFIEADGAAYLARIANEEQSPSDKVRNWGLDEAQKNADPLQNYEGTDPLAETRKAFADHRDNELLKAYAENNVHLTGLPLPGETGPDYVTRQMMLKKIEEGRQEQDSFDAEVGKAVEELTAEETTAIEDEQAQIAFVQDLTSDDPADREFAITAWLGELGFDPESPEADELCTIASGYLADGYEPLVALQLAQASVEYIEE